MAVVEKTIDILGDEAFSAWLLSKNHQEGWPVDIYDEVVPSLCQYAMYKLGGVQSVKFTRVTQCNAYSMANCNDLVSVDLPACTSFADNVLRSCSHLTTLILPELQSVGQYCFTYCVALEEINLPKLTSAASAGVFQECTSLRTVILPSLKTMGNAMFHGCSSLERIDLPSIESIRSNVFTASVEVINLGPNIASISSDAFSRTQAGVVINLPVAEGVISGAPWGAPDAVINYEVPYSGDVPIPT